MFNIYPYGMQITTHGLIHEGSIDELTQRSHVVEVACIAKLDIVLEHVVLDFDII